MNYVLALCISKLLKSIRKFQRHCVSPQVMKPLKWFQKTINTNIPGKFVSKVPYRLDIYEL